ncbi:MAG: hypothetical protein ACFCU4_10760 [Puniceicoccaceae bacterium]
MIKLPNRKNNPLIWYIVLISVIVHGVALIIFGGWTMLSYALDDGQDFIPPEQIQAIDPQKLNFQAQLKQKQAQSSRPRNRIEVKSLANVELQSISIDLPTIATTANIGGNIGGLGAGMQAGSLSLSAPQVSFFGVGGRGEKFLFMVDISGNTMRDSKGGLPAFKILQDSLVKETRALPRGTLFNVIFLDERRIWAWRPQLIPVTDQNLSEFETTIRGLNQSATSYGIPRGSATAVFKQVPAPLGPDPDSRTLRENLNQFIFATAASMLPDTIFLFTSKSMDSAITLQASDEVIEQRRAEHEKRVEAYLKRSGFASMKEARDFRNRMDAETSKVFNEMVKSIEGDRVKKGLPPKVWGDGEKDGVRSRAESQVMSNNPEYRTRLAGWPNDFSTTMTLPTDAFNRFWSDLLIDLYDRSTKSVRPVLNAIYFKGKDEGDSAKIEAGLAKWVSVFRRGAITGEVRILDGLKDIRRAAGLPDEGA